MNLIKRILAAIMVLAVLLSFAGCGDTTWIAEIDGTVVPSGLYIYYQTEGYGNALLELYRSNSDYLMPYLYFYNYGAVYADILGVEMSDGKTVEEYINEYAMNMCEQAVVLDRIYDKVGLEMTAEEKDAVDTQVRNLWNNGKESYEAIGISQESLRKAVLATFKESVVFDAYYEIGGLNGTTEEEIENEFASDYARVKYMTFTFGENIEDAVDSARKDEQLALANSYLERAQAGESMDALIEEYNAYLEQLAAEEAEENGETEPETDAEAESSDETEEAAETEDDEYKYESIIGVNQTTPTEKFVNYVFNNCPVGEFTVIQDDLCFYLVQRLDILERDGLYENYRDSILTELFDDDYTALINNTLSELSETVNEKSLKRYTVRKAFPDAIEE